MIKIIAFVTLLFFAHAAVIYSPNGYDPGFAIFCFLIYCFIFIIRFHLGRGNFAGYYYSPLRPDLLFLIFYALVFIVPYVQAAGDDFYIYGNKFIDNLFANNSNKAIAISVVYAGFFVLGSTISEKYYFCIEKFFLFRNINAVVITSYRLNVFLLIVVMVFFEVSGASSMMSGEYTGLGGDSSTSDGIYFLMTQFSMSAAAFFIVGSSGSVKIWIAIDKFLQFVVIFWMMRLLASGDRNNFLLILMVYIIGFAVYIRSVNFVTLCVIGCFGWIVYQVVEVTRASGARSITEFFDAIVKYGLSVEDQKISESSISLTTTTLRASIELQPLGDALYYGWFKLVGFMGVVPYSRQLLSAPSDGFYTSAQAITNQILGADPTWSLGSNIISDVMLDLGIYGGGMLILLLGYCSTIFVRMASGFNLPFSSAFYLLVGSLFFQMPRYSYDFPVRNLFWFLLVLYASWFVCGLKEKN